MKPKLYSGGKFIVLHVLIIKQESIKINKTHSTERIKEFPDKQSWAFVLLLFVDTFFGYLASEASSYIGEIHHGVGLRL